MEQTRRFTPAHLHAVARRALMAAGTPRHVAEIVAGHMVEANLTGHDSHGVLRISEYLSSIQEKRIDPAAEPVVVKETPNVLVIDGRRGFGHYVARETMRRAVLKAKKGDVCAAAIVRATHIGRLGEYAEQAATAGCFGLVAYGHGGPGEGMVVPYGGARAALGTNPISAGLPAADGRPFVLDFATSRIAAGKIRDARSRGVQLPEGALIDRNGRPSVSPADSEGGFLLPAGGHKGYALSVLVTLLGGLTGQFDAAAGTMSGVFMLAMNVGAFTSEGPYRQAAAAFLESLRSTPPALGFEEVLAPGDPERRSRARRLAQGIEVPAPIWHQIGEWTAKFSVSLAQIEPEDTDGERYVSEGPGTAG